MDTDSSDEAISLTGLQKSYGNTKVLRGVDLKVRPGQILGLLGKNGAGKSTLITIMCGMLRPDSGQVRICGKDPSRRSIGRYIGYAPQDIAVYPHLSVEQNLTSIGRIQGMSAAKSAQRAYEVIEVLGLGNQAKQNAGDLSGGQKRRLHTGMALMHHPRVAFLDEPTVGADVEARNRILHMVRSLADEGTAVVYTSHYLTEFEKLNAAIAILNEGTIAASGTIPDIISRYSDSSIHVSFASGTLPDVSGWREEEGHLTAEGPAEDPGRAIARLLADPQVDDSAVSDIRIVRPSLENVYLNIVGTEKTADEEIKEK